MVRPARLAALRAMRATYRSRRPVLGAREEFAELLNRRRLLGSGAEVGVKRGEFSESLLDRWKGCHLVSIDPWLEANDYADIANVAQTVHEGFYAETRERLERFGARSTIWRMTGAEAAPMILHHSLDFVYLDARHDFDSLSEDLTTWFDRVRPGGLIAGHDYVDGTFADGVFGVRSAVDAFFSERGLRVNSTLMDRPYLSWFVALPAATA